MRLTAGRVAAQRGACLPWTGPCIAAADGKHEDEEAIRSQTPPPREATPRQQARWKAVHHARLQGVSPGGIARELGISRNTVRKYVDSQAPPVNRTGRRAAYLATQDKTGGHFP